MSYGLIYTVPFASFRNEACVVEIEREGYTGSPMELTGADTPFEVDIEDDDFLYIPTRFSTARIRVVGSDYLQSLFSTAYQQYRVTFKREGVVTWCGFVKPEIYTQDYSSDKFELEIECMSAMSVLEFINYKQTGEDGKVFVSLWDLLKKCIDSSRGQYSAVYIPHVYARDKRHYDLDSEPFDVMTVSEQNFFDEDDKPMKLKEVLEEICKLLNWTCVDYLGELYFVDIDHSDRYHSYNMLPNWNACLIVGQKDVLNVQEIGFSGNGQVYDKLNGYNKVTVKTSNYNVGDMLPKEDEKFKGLAQFGNEYRIERDGKITLKNFYLPQVYKLHRYVNSIQPIPDSELEKYKDAPNSILGAQLVKRSQYDTSVGANNYKWEHLIQVRGRHSSQIGTVHLSAGDTVLSLISPLPSIAYTDGAIGISASIQVSNRDDLTAGFGNQSGNMVIRCSLGIGNKWYRGHTKQWQDVKGTFDLVFDLNNYDGSGFVANEGTKDLTMPYEGMEGYIIEMPRDYILRGQLTFAMELLYKTSLSLDEPIGYWIKDLKLLYQRRDDLEELNDNSDRYYENIVNEDYINELDEIEFKISSYNNDGACYSKVLLDGNYLTDNLYSAIADKAIRPEEHLIQRIVNRYSAPRIKLTQVIKETSELTPLTKLSDNFMVGKIFMPAGGSIDYKMGQFKCVMVEI